MSKLLTLLKRGALHGHKLINNGVITDEAIFTRASSATCFVNGVLTSFTTNTPRFGTYAYGDTYTGFIFEGARTNYVKNSTDSLGGSWGRNNTTSPVVGSVATPIPGVSAPLYVPDNSASLHNLSPHAYGGVLSNIDYISGTTYTFSCFVYSSNTSIISKMRFESPNASVFSGTQWGGGMYVDLATGAVSGNATGTTTTVLPNGWIYVKMVKTAIGTSTQKAFPILYPNTYGNNPGNGVAAYAIAGCQAEVGTFASSYIPTSGATVARAADICKITNLSSKSWWNSSEGTLVINFQRGAAVDIYSHAVSINNANYTERLDIKQDSSGGSRSIYGIAVAAGTQNVAIGKTTGNANIAAKVAYAFKNNDYALSLNGGTVGTSGSGAFPSVTQIEIGSNTWDANGFFGTINGLVYYPLRLSNTTLKALTA